MTRANVMIVEDDPGLLEGLRAILELDEYTVITAENGIQALDMLYKCKPLPDLIVSDIMMPYMDGLELLRRVRQVPDWLRIPFIFLTARSDKADVQLGKRMGVDDYLVKPFDAEELLVAVESRLKRQQAINNAHSATLETIKRNILTILNHEFRTPLTFVVAYADMLTHMNSMALSEDDLMTFLKGVGVGANRLRRLIENFILLVELETGDARRTFEWRKSVIDDMDALLRTACERAILLEDSVRPYAVWVENGLPPLTADREYLLIALIQLISNAIKFSAPDKPVVVGAKADGEDMLLWVQDQGRGISPEELEHIWEIFYQVNRTEFEDQGAGSGLAIVRGIAALHGGQVEVQSTLSVGSRFMMRLPCHA